LKNRKKAFVIILSLSVAALHFIIGPNYRGPFKDFLSGYLINILLPFALYFLFTLNLNQRRHKILVCIGIFVFATAIEYLQYRGLGIFGSVFDPYDFLAYLAGVISAIVLDFAVLDKILRKKQGI
jgi:asparagine N-glycosylation enzyme membrane subunit Stt3